MVSQTSAFRKWGLICIVGIESERRERKKREKRKKRVGISESRKDRVVLS